MNSLLTITMSLINAVINTGSTLTPEGELIKSANWIRNNPCTDVMGDDCNMTASSMEYMDDLKKVVARNHPKKKDSLDLQPYKGFGVYCDGLDVSENGLTGNYLSLNVVSSTAIGRMLPKIVAQSTTVSLRMSSKEAYRMLAIS